jgi:hypothetical protein
LRRGPYELVFLFIAVKSLIESSATCFEYFLIFEKVSISAGVSMNDFRAGLLLPLLVVDFLNDRVDWKPVSSGLLIHELLIAKELWVDSSLQLLHIDIRLVNSSFVHGFEGQLERSDFFGAHIKGF